MKDNETGSTWSVGSGRVLAGESIDQQVEVAGLAFDLRYSPVRDEDGAPAGAIGRS